MSSFRDLRVWQEGIDLCVSTYRRTENFPKREWFGLAVQMRRAALSIPSNIAEGQGRLTTRDCLRFLGIARGSLFELQTQIEIAVRLGYFDRARAQTLIGHTATVGRSLAGYITYSLQHRDRRRE
jgi:four helix bundle protein